MARSGYVYLVWDRELREPLQAFTVKHEMVSWLSQNRVRSALGWTPSTWQAIRFRSGRPGYQVMEDC